MEYLTVGYETALEGVNPSLNYRFESWERAYKIFQESPLVGWGPAKLVHITVVDSEYFLTLRRYGILGIIMLLSVIFYVPRLLIKHRKILNKLSKESYLLSLVMLNYSIAAAVLMMTNIFFHGYKLFTLYIILASLTYLEISRLDSKPN